MERGGTRGRWKFGYFPPRPPKYRLGEPLQNSRKMVEKRKISPGIMKVRKIFEKVDTEKESKIENTVSKVKEIKNTFENMMNKKTSKYKIL